MYKKTFLLLLIFLQVIAYAQQIDYTLPPGLEKNISKEDYKKIVDAAVPIIQQRYKIESVHEGTVALAKDQGMQAFNLDNLVVKCTDEKNKKLWQAIIQNHFGQIFASVDERNTIDLKNFESVKKYLSIRIYPKETVLQRGGIEGMVYKTDLEGTYTLLMLDLPDAFTNVQKDIFDLWKKDSAAIFRMAQDNINSQPVEKVTQKFNIDESDIEISFIGDENYAASYALDLANNSPELVGEWGSVVAIPNKGLVNICKISKDHPVDFVKFIQRTKPMIEKSYTGHPQPISNQYFWYYKGKFTRINVLTDKEGKINVVAPVGLSTLMTTQK